MPRKNMSRETRGSGGEKPFVEERMRWTIVGRGKRGGNLGHLHKKHWTSEAPCFLSDLSTLSFFASGEQLASSWEPDLFNNYYFILIPGHGHAAPVPLCCQSRVSLTRTDDHALFSLRALPPGGDDPDGMCSSFVPHLCLICAVGIK